MKNSHVAALIGLCILLTGCASSPLPPPLSANEATQLKEMPLPYTVGVARSEPPSYSDALTRALDSSGVFRRVAASDQFQGKPDFIATVEEQVYGTAVLPAATFGTVGVVPTVTEERFGYRFALAPTSHPNRKKFVDATYSGKTTLGWAAIAINSSANFTSGDPEDTERFKNMLRYRILNTIRPKSP